MRDDIRPIKGEKKEEKEEKDKNYYMSERLLWLLPAILPSCPPGVDQGKIDASFQEGRADRDPAEARPRPSRRRRRSSSRRSDGGVGVE